MPGESTTPVMTDIGYLQRLATTAAAEAAANVRDQGLTDKQMDKVEEIAKRVAAEVSEQVAEKVLERFMERIGVEKDKLPEFRKDILWLQGAREFFKTFFRQAIIAGSTLSLGGIVTAIIYTLKSGGPK